MKDFLGKELSLGDKVVFVQLGYRNLLKGEIIKMTAKTVLIGHSKTNTYSAESKQFPDQVIKIDTTKEDILTYIQNLNLGAYEKSKTEKDKVKKTTYETFMSVYTLLLMGIKDKF